MSIPSRLRAWARALKGRAMTLWFARRHPATPWYAKALGTFVVAYALSPIDLVPDFIPVLGYLDDVILLPGLIWLTLRLLPAEVLADSRREAEAFLRAAADRPTSRAGAVVIVLLWLGLGVAGASAAWVAWGR